VGVVAVVEGVEVVEVVIRVCVNQKGEEVDVDVNPVRWWGASVIFRNARPVVGCQCHIQKCGKPAW
jgi:hypothetical protein